MVVDGMPVTKKNNNKQSETLLSKIKIQELTRIIRQFIIVTSLCIQVNLILIYIKEYFMTTNAFWDVA